MKPSITLIIPALNEEADLQATVFAMLTAMKDRFSSYEIFIFDDGSTDQTGKIADKLAAENSNIKVVHHPRNRGAGYCLRSGYQLAIKDYVMWNAADNAMLEKSLEDMFEAIAKGDADIIIPYIGNPEFRSRTRRIISNLYVVILSFVFGLKLHYLNGPVYRTKLIQSVRTSTVGFAYFAEALIPLVKAGCRYVEVPTFHRNRQHGKSKAINIKNLWEVFVTFARLFWDLNIKKDNRINSCPEKSNSALLEKSS